MAKNFVRTVPYERPIPESLQRVLNKTVDVDHKTRLDFQTKVPVVVANEQEWAPAQDLKKPQKLLGKVRVRSKATGREFYVYDGEFGANQDKYESLDLPVVAPKDAPLSFDKVIKLFVNPTSIQVSLPIRGARQKTKGGEVRFNWPRVEGKDKVYFDVFPVAFTFQTGNLFKHYQDPTYGDVTPGLDDFYRFIALLNEPRLLPSGRENWNVVMFTSKVFPSITFKGWWDENSISWAESSDAPNTLQWSATLSVHKTFPRLWNVRELRQIFGSVI